MNFNFIHRKATEVTIRKQQYTKNMHDKVSG